MTYPACDVGATLRGRTLMNQAKPFPITKRQVWEAYKRAKAYKGGAGVDSQSIEDFERV
ncbi:hypothetical protein GCM10011533_35630 [Streptosporangium jomthongense]|nr:hypothetical protein GCM10011533_35630 [Streptosporangium jomthongense]